MQASLSVVASKIFHLREAESFAYDEMKAFYAPEECYLDVWRGFLQKEKDVLAESEWTAKSYNEALEASTTPKWAYFSGLYVGEEAGLR